MLGTKINDLKKNVCVSWMLRQEKESTKKRILCRFAILNFFVLIDLNDLILVFLNQKRTREINIQIFLKSVENNGKYS